VRKLLDAFDALTEPEKVEAAAELLRRSPHRQEGILTDEALVEAADLLFRELDEREATDAHA
jgi:hypothetical protein